MAARTGKQYLENLRANQPEVYLNGRRVNDVTTEAVFAGPLMSIMQQYDLQHEPANLDVMTFIDPDTGERHSTSFLIARSKEELIRRRQHHKLRTDHNFGFMGRAPDFMNAIVTDFYLMRDIFSQLDPRYTDNMAAYYAYVRDNDLFLTHTLVNPQVDRSKTSAEQEEPYTHLGRVRATDEGIVVRGAKMLGTMAPLCEETMVFPYGGVAPGDEAYALAFAIPNHTPGLKYICRETVAPGPRTRFDHPLSSRFEEMDCIAIFDDVVVPWERVFIDGGSPQARQLCNALQLRGGSVVVQTAIRMLSQLEFFCGLAMRLADSTGITGFLHVQEKLGEMLTELELFRAAYYGAEAMAAPGQDGVWTVHQQALAATRLRAPHVYARLVEIVQILAGGGFFYAPTQGDLDNEALRPYIDKYVRGRPGISAEERIALFKLAWDVTGDSFGSRMAQYVRFYSGDPIRNMAGYYLGYPTKDALFNVVDRALGAVADLAVPMSAVDGRDQGMRRAPEPGALAGAYPASSVPRPTTS
jgi:4-hydroxyphenylacetate 3-monooxygenase oxygenase component